MAFGKNLCQTGATPAENNYCGGYVMSAVLSDLKKETDPMSVYKEMLDSQKTVGPSLQGFIDSTKRNGTDICLPSSLASYARGKGLAAGIGFAKQPSFPGEVTEEETQRCPEMVKQYDSAEQMLDNFAGSDLPYCLVLVKGCHWIAVKRKSEDKGFAVYDPATGQRQNVAEGQLKEHLRRMDKHAGEVVITLEPA